MQSDVKDKVKRIWCLSATGVKRSSRGLPGSGGGGGRLRGGGDLRRDSWFGGRGGWGQGCCETPGGLFRKQLTRC